MSSDKDLLESLTTFMCHFEYVFDGEWNDFSKELLYKDNVDSYISPNGTFLNPKVDDEEIIGAIAGHSFQPTDSLSKI